MLDKKINARKLVRLMSMRVLRIEPDDVLVLQTDLMLNRDQATALRERASEQFGKQFGRIAILSAGLKIGVLRKSGKRQARIKRRGE